MKQLKLRLMVELVNCFESKLNNKNNIHQVAVICPTTFLANQHYKQFCERFKEFPDIKIALL